MYCNFHGLRHGLHNKQLLKVTKHNITIPKQLMNLSLAPVEISIPFKLRKELAMLCNDHL